MNYEEELFDAVLDGDIKFAKDLINKGADINEVTPSEHWTYFHHIFKSIGEHAPLESIKFLLEKGLDVNAIDSYGNTPLLYAVRQRNAEGMRLLLENGADKLIEHENLEGVSALRMGFDSMPFNYEVFDLLLQFGANPDKKSTKGSTVREGLNILAGIPDNIKALFTRY